MTPAARVQGAIEVFDRLLAKGEMVDVVLRGWAKENRYAGSKDRLAIADMVYDALRKRKSLSVRGGGLSGRQVLYALLLHHNIDPESIYTGQKYAPDIWSEAERSTMGEPNGDALYDLPDWLVPMWRRELGEESLSLAQTLTARAPVFLRTNLLQVTRDKLCTSLEKEGIISQNHINVSTALVVKDGYRQIRHSMAYQHGNCELQDASSQASVADLPDTVQGPILDFCAGAGGKSLALAAHYKSAIDAHDGLPHRMAAIPARAKRAGAEIHVKEASDLKEKHYGLVFCDMPCSGSGTWRRDPLGKWTLEAKQFESLLKLQASILENAAAYVRSGGYLVYATCSVLKSENADQIHRFLSLHSGWSAQKMKQFWPDQDGDGFFYCQLHKQM